MKIAVTYENGKIFQHFGHTEQFKVYDVEDGKIVSAEVVGANGAGHEALAGVLADKAIEVLICGGMGQGAQDALAAEGITTVTGVDGDADEAVEAYLAGELKSAGVNCDHHSKEEEAGSSCGSSCGGGCGGCHGGCHTPEPIMEGKNVGKTVRAHYKGTFNDGQQFDSSYDRGEPLEFVCGVGMMIRGFDAAVANMEVGEIVNVHLMPEEAYGESDPNQIFTIPCAQLPGSEKLTAGQQVWLQNSYGQPFQVKVTACDGENVTFDANHEMAGKELNFQIELVEIK